MSKADYKTIDEYIILFPKETQSVLKKLRQTIKKAAPETTEGISYGIPTFYLNGKYLVYFAGFKNHVSVYPATTSAVNKADLSKYKVSKGTLRFPLDKPIPYMLIEKFSKERLKENSKNEGY